MLTDELIHLVHEVCALQCEPQIIEVKCAKGGTPKIYDSLSSFSNQSGGGIILFGIDEKSGYTITGVHDAQKLQKDVTNQALEMEPVIRPVFTVAVIDDKKVMSAEIPECDPYSKPCFHKSKGRLRGSYVRVGDADLPMTEYEVYSYEAFRRNIQDELRVVERAEASDLDRDALAEFFIRLKKIKPNLAKQSDEKILQLQGITDKGRPTIAGIMMLGEYPQGFFPQLSVTAMVVDGTEIGPLGTQGERFIDNQRIEGTLTQMLEATLAFVRRNMRTATIIDENGQRADLPEYPIVAVREIILNALIHRDYSVHTDHSPIRVILYQDRLEVENPGGLYGRLTVKDLGLMPADTRNPFIANGLEVLLGTENRFSGIPTIIHEMKQAGLPPAIFESRRGMFKVTLYNKRVQDTPSTQSAELPHEIQDLIAFCQKPRSRKELMEYLGLKTWTYVLQRYIQPLIDQGVLEMTLPDTPRSRNQRYVRVAH